MKGQQPILRAVPAGADDLSEDEHVELMLTELAAVVQEHLPHLSESNPWQDAAREILRQATATLGRRRVRLASHG